MQGIVKPKQKKETIIKAIIRASFKSDETAKIAVRMHKGTQPINHLMQFHKLLEAITEQHLLDACFPCHWRSFVTRLTLTKKKDLIAKFNKKKRSHSQSQLTAERFLIVALTNLAYEDHRRKRTCVQLFGSTSE